jgi:hypothetical protein
MKRFKQSTFCLCVGLFFSLTSVFAQAKSRAKSTSGIYGYSTQRGFSAEIGFLAAYDYDLIIKDAKSKRVVKKVHTKNSGNFTITLLPGRYILIPVPGRNNSSSPSSIEVGNKNNNWFNKQANITVWQGYYTPVAVIFED